MLKLYCSCIFVDTICEMFKKRSSKLKCYFSNEEYSLIHKFEFYEAYASALCISGKCIKCPLCWPSLLAQTKMKLTQNIKPIILFYMNHFVKHD